MGAGDTSTERGGAEVQGEVVIDDPILRRRFVMLPRPVIVAANLSEGAKLLYALILDFAWQSDHAWPGQERMAALLGINARTVRRYLQELVAVRLVGIEHRWTGKSTPQNIYHILDLSRALLPSNEAKGGRTPGQNCPGVTHKGDSANTFRWRKDIPRSLKC